MTATAELLTRIICEKFEVDPAKIKPEATPEDIGIDSLDIFDVVFSAEEALDIKVPNDNVKVANFQDLVHLIDRVRVAQGRT
ncbi:MAG TPA: phosphopantetheine-binding protein [Rhodocyclaceae bacterium]|nr:phosphopantetheine-binding protein [Rhodocyclaceae bacterium]